MFEVSQGEPRSLTLYTDSAVVKGTITSRQHRVTDLLNGAEEGFLVLEGVTIDEWGSRSEVLRVDFAQVNLDAVLFAVSDTPVAPLPELRIPRTPQKALISVPPFRVVGLVHLAADGDLRHGLSNLTGRFVPVTDATYWSETLAEPRTAAVMVAVNHRRAQIFAPYQVADPWAGLGPARSDEGEPPEAG
jgi:hypothetical protein